MSGNPSGRSPVIQHVRDLARVHTVEAVGVLVEIMRDKYQPAPARVAAASQILDRGYGKPTQPIDVKPRTSAEDFTDDELKVLAGLGVESIDGAEPPEEGEGEPSQVH